MSITDELCQLLDERGAKYQLNEYTKVFEWHFDGTDGEGSAHATEANGGINIMACSLTPEQAVEATLGAGTCRDVCSSVSEFTCSACGFNCDLTSWISLFDGDEGRHRCHHHGTPNYCPNCGREVVE